jgi:hypothetical protein
MNYQHPIPISVREIFTGNGEFPDQIDYYAWPQVFGSTCGPRKGIGGQAMTTFTIEAYVNIMTKSCVYVCAEMCHYERGTFEPFKTVKDWKRLPTIHN